MIFVLFTGAIVLFPGVAQSYEAYSIDHNFFIKENPISKNPSDIDFLIDKDQFCIIYPLSTVPALVEKDDFFIIKFQANEFDNVYPFISTAYEIVVDEIWLEVQKIWKEDLFWNMEVYVPVNTPVELYNLSLLFFKDNNFYKISQPRALNVYDEISNNFSFIHITDFHYGDPRGFIESIKETIGFKSIKRCVKEINLLHPDFVIISGDVVFGQLYPFEYRREYKKCYDLIQTFDVPTFLAPGNHDGYRRFREDGLEYWEEYFGPLYYSFNFGNYHFIAVNSYDMSVFYRLSFLFLALNWGGSISDEQINWITQDLESSNSENKIMFMHHNPLWETRNQSLMLKKFENREELLNLIYKHNVDMVLAGHVHVDSVNIENDVIFVTTTTPESEIRKSDGYWGYRLIEVENNEIISFNYKDPKYSIPSYKLDYHIWHSNRLALAIVENDLDMDVRVLIKFLLPFGNYETDIGHITLIRNDSYFSEIYVQTDVSRLSKKVVNIFPI
jgi:DNA repair exonuclease SbcCD nuclease subunit